MNDVLSFDGVASAIAGDVILGLWQRPARIARVRWFSERMDQVAATSPDGFIVLMLILPSSSPPDAETRAFAKVSMGKHGKKLRRLITVPLGDAFWTNIVRTIMRGMVMITGQSSTHDVVATERLALERLRQAASTKTPPAALLETLVDELFRALGETRARPASTG